jgi:hypothetical protein
MLILLSLVAYLVLGLPFVAWLGHRLAQSHREPAAVTDAVAAPPVVPEITVG